MKINYNNMGHLPRIAFGTILVLLLLVSGAYAPPTIIPTIDSPDNNSSFLQGEIISFQGNVSGGTAPYDYSWTSSIDGFIGNVSTIDNGPFNRNRSHIFNFSLSTGTHVITMTVNDSETRTNSASITVTINSSSTTNISGQSGTGAMTWNASNFLALTTETLNVVSLTDRTIAGDDLWYNTSKELVQYKVFSATGETVDYGLNGGGYYAEVGWFGKTYVALKGQTRKLAKPILEQNETDSKTLEIGETWDLGDGYTLKLNSIDSEELPWLASVTLNKSGTILDDKVAQNFTVYTYVARDMGHESDVPMFVTYFDNISTNSVRLKYTWLISGNNILEPGPADRIGNLEVWIADDNQINMTNKDTSITLSQDSTQNIAYELRFRVNNTDTLEYYPEMTVISSGDGGGDACRTISSPGEYTLNASIIGNGSSPCITIDSSDVIFDGAGFTIDGNGQDGVYVYNASITLTNVTVKNLIVTNSISGIFYRDVTNGSITNNNASSNYNGIYLYYSGNNTLTNNTANSNDSGIYLDSSSNNTLTNNTANLNRYGIEIVSSSDNNTLTNNTASSNTDTGIYQDFSNNNNLTGNTANSNTNYGIYLSSSLYNHLTSNTANSNNYGIELVSFDDNSYNTLTGNNASLNTNTGIYLDSTNNNNLTDNTASSNDYYGIYLDGSMYNHLTGNTANSNDNGIYLYSSPYNRLTGNTANLNTYGIYFDSSEGISEGNTLTKNTVNDNSYGIYLSSSSKNNIGASVTIPETSFRWVNVNTSTASTAGSGEDITDYRNYTMQNDDDYFTYKMPFTFQFRGRSITNISVNTNGLIELLEEGENCYGDCSELGTHAANSHIGVMDAIFASNDDLVTLSNLTTDYLGVFNLGNKIVVEWNGSTYADYGAGYDSGTYPVWFQVVLYPNGIVEWNFNRMEFSSYGNDMWSGAYAKEENLEYAAGYAIRSHKSFRKDLSATAISTSYNIISNNTDTGIYLDTSDSNIISYSNVTSNGVYGITLTSSSSNTIFNNYFNNNYNANDDAVETPNTWNTTKTPGTNIVGGPYLGGNFWSDYAGNDTDGDSLGNTLAPYNSFDNIANGGDYLPLLTARETSLSDYINTTNATVTTAIIMALPDENITIDVPVGTVARNASGGALTSITTDALDNVGSSGQNAAASASLSFLGKNLSLEPEGATFSPPIQIRFNYTDADLEAANILESDLVVKWYNKTSGAWESLDIYRRNPTEKYIIANASHFSTFALLGTTSTGGGSTGGSGGGSSGGGIVTAEPYDNIAKSESYDKDLVANTPVTYTFKAPELGVYEIAFTGKENEIGITLRVEGLKDTSKKVTAPAPGTVYKNINILTGTKRMKEAQVRFRVENSWLGSNSISGSDVKLLHWDGSQWTQLETAQTTKDDSYTYYEAKTDTFSSFAISGLKGGVIVPTATPPQLAVTTAVEGTPQTGVAPAAGTRTGILASLLGLALPVGEGSVSIFWIIGLIIAAAVLYLIRRKRSP